MPLLFVAGLSVLAAVAVPAPITAVTVYSDRARVTRTAHFTVAGTQRIELPLLLENVDPATIWVEAEGAEVRRVDIARVEATAFPSDEARDLIGKIEQADDLLARNAGDQRAARAVLQAIGSLRPATPAAEPVRAVPKLNPSGWGGAFSFIATWTDRLLQRSRVLDEKRVDLARDRQGLVERARLIGGAGRHAGYRVAPTLAGSGAVKISVTYMVGNARWYPIYDLQLLPEKGQVQVSFAGRVSQESGEDWTDATLVLSTAVPATSTVVPKLYTWKIGERERFVPTPIALAESLRPPPPASPTVRTVSDEDQLRRRIAALADAAPPASGAKNDQPNAQSEEVDRDGDGIPDALDRCPDDGSPGSDDGCPSPNRQRAGEDRPMAKPRPEPVMERQMAAPEATVQSASAPSKSWFKGFSFGSSSSAPQPTAEVGLSPPSGYRPPSYAANLPAALAGGYDLTFPSLRPETVRSGKGARRVALFAEAWPVAVERRLFPALAPDAFLVAEIKNPSQRVLPGGEASLFVGDDPAGSAALAVVAPGEVFTLPLGLDRAVKAVRNVKLVLSEKGIFSKDEINRYFVASEVANPYRVPLKVRLVDQLPLSTDKNVEVKLLTVDGGAKQDPITGAIEWLITVPPSQKAQLNFVYTVRRPKGWRLHQ